jgi:hypothetical protein
MYPPREVAGFSKKDELDTLIRRREQRKPLDVAQVKDAIAGRYYQKRAIGSIAQHFAYKSAPAHHDWGVPRANGSFRSIPELHGSKRRPGSPAAPPTLHRKLNKEGRPPPTRGCPKIPSKISDSPVSVTLTVGRPRGVETEAPIEAYCKTSSFRSTKIDF